MKPRPFELSSLSYGDFTLMGYSVAGEESVIIVPELDVCFDVGRCPRQALRVNNLLLTHGHADHSVGLLYWFAQRDFQGVECGRAFVPANLVKPLIDLVRAWGRVEGQTPPYDFVGLKAGQDVEIRRGLIARPFATRHVSGSLGFSLLDVRKKLKEQYLGLTGPEIVQLKNRGVEITNTVEVPLVAYPGDTGVGDFLSLPCVRDARVLLLECTFFDEDHRSRARAGRHIHVKDLPEALAQANNQHIVLIHVTRRTNMSQARRILKRTMPEHLLDRITFLMSRAHIESD